MSDPTPEIAKSDSPTDACSTVKFDVGGRLYKVSRSLIEKFPSTMLARMISETWQKDPEVTLFIDRDSDRFRFCLDYMRDDEVWLPLNVPIEGFLLDLDYFGFEEVDTSEIHGGSSNLAAARHLRKCIKQHEKVLSTCMENVKAAETTSHCEEVAYECFVRFSRGESLAMSFSYKSSNYLYHSVETAVANLAELQGRLAKFGLALVKSETTVNNQVCTLTLTLKEKEDTIN
jgi:hypothetical protein